MCLAEAYQTYQRTTGYLIPHRTCPTDTKKSLNCPAPPMLPATRRQVRFFGSRDGKPKRRSHRNGRLAAAYSDHASSESRKQAIGERGSGTKDRILATLSQPGPPASCIALHRPSAPLCGVQRRPRNWRRMHYSALSSSPMSNPRSPDRGPLYSPRENHSRGASSHTDVAGAGFGGPVSVSRCCLLSPELTWIMLLCLSRTP